MPNHPLKNYRKQQSLTQNRLAKQLGVDRVTVARWESGSRRMDDKLLPKVSRLTGIPKRELRPDLAELVAEPA